MAGGRTAVTINMVKPTHMYAEDIRWKEVLQAEGFQGGGVRENVLARLLVQNDFLSLRQLKHAPHPAAWPHAMEGLKEEEIGFLGTLIAKQRQVAGKLPSAEQDRPCSSPSK